MPQPTETKDSDDLNVRPMTVLLGIMLGTVFSISCGLLVVSLIFWLLESDYPRLRSEIPELLRATTMFLTLTLFAGLGFFGSLRSLPWRHIPMAGLWLALLLVGNYYWPD